jgi:Family of unknown function (DUF6064)
MNPPFTIEQFLGVFAAYNQAIWPFQIMAYSLGIVAVMAIWRTWTSAHWLIPSILAVMWAVNAIGYHYFFFTTINPAAIILAGFFAVQAALLGASAAFDNDTRFVFDRDLRSITGAAFIVYAMLVYPLLGYVAGHGFMQGPMLGVAPCPTTIFTIGLLLLARGKWVAWLSVIPILWSLVGFAAALQLGMPEDFGLPAAAVALVIALTREKLRAIGSTPATRRVGE